jgi:hypothetical protein
MVGHLGRLPGHPCGVLEPEVNIRPEQAQHFAQMLREQANAREWRDVILTMGGTIKDMRPGRNPKPVWVKNVQKRLR